MNDPVGNLRYCFTPLMAYIADTPEQTLLSGTSPKASPVSTVTYKEFSDPYPHPPWTATRTLDNIKQACMEADLDGLEYFLKIVKCFFLNGIYKPFWRNWLLSDPSIFFNPEVLHHFHHLFWDHDLQWCIVLLRPDKIDYCFSLIQTAVGYRSFQEGVSKLKQVTGCDHCAVQRYIIRVIVGAVPPKFLAAIRALLNFQYLAQMPHFDDNSLNRIEAALHAFHANKSAIITAGSRQGSKGPLEHWEIPKLELLQHVIPSIRASGAIMQWSANVTEHTHVTEIKQPACSGNNQDYYSQIAWYLDRSDKCFRFDIATQLASAEQGGPDNNNDNKREEDEHEPDSEALHVSHYHIPTHRLVNYFETTEGIANSVVLNTVLPPRFFSSSSTAFCLAVKPSLRVSIDEASELYGLPEL